MGEGGQSGEEGRRETSTGRGACVAGEEECSIFTPPCEDGMGNRKEEFQAFVGFRGMIAVPNRHPTWQRKGGRGEVVHHFWYSSIDSSSFTITVAGDTIAVPISGIRSTVA